MKLHLGTIISGTHRPQDLLDAFANTLALHDHHNNKKLIELAHILAKGLERECSTFLLQETIEEVLDKLEAKLQALCPIGFYFGTHPDDASDFGVWPDMDPPEEGKVCGLCGKPLGECEFACSATYDEMMTGYEQWLDDEASKADYLHQFMKEQE